jgi:hypothetical protein
MVHTWSRHGARRGGLSFAAAFATVALGCGGDAAHDGEALEHHFGPGGESLASACIDFEDEAWADLGKSCAPDAAKYGVPEGSDPGADGPRTSRRLFTELAQVVPGGFGGYWFKASDRSDRERDPEAEQDLVVALVDPRQREEALSTLADVAADMGIDGRIASHVPDAEICQARWDHIELHTWYEKLWGEMFAVDGVSFGGISEHENRIRFGASEEALPAVEAKLRELDVPCYLVALEVAGPACDLVLRSKGFRVVDAQGEPVDDVDVVVTHKESGEILDTSDPEPHEPGTYVLVTSNHIGLVGDGDTLVVTGEKGDAGFEEEFIVRTDGCHPDSIEGPEEIVLDVD